MSIIALLSYIDKTMTIQEPHYVISPKTCAPKGAWEVKLEIMTDKRND